uniref:CLIP domain-containing serine protease n=1 Tax=Anopheles culicifacies TaxID=139723 RepID=A0A182MV97_9DIPT
MTGKRVMGLLIAGLLALAGQMVSALELGQDCVNPIGQAGKCVLFRECQPLIEIYQKPVNTPDDTQFLTESRCGVFERKTLVCCPGVKNAEKTSLPEAPNCGIQLSDRIVGGQPTKIDEFPWTALIEYQKPDGRFGFHCGGSIINERYIVTAAHCINAIPRNWKVHRVRLGEWDLSSSSDCEDDFCSIAPIDLDIEKIIVHSGYDARDKSHHNDIALIRFNREIHYSATVRPICLPLSNSIRNRKHDGLTSYAAGWGKTETASASQKKLKVELKVVDLAQCAPLYQRNSINLDSTQMCAGGVRGKDTCSGDSGGPLMRQIAGSWYLIGVVSFGPQKCGTATVPDFSSFSGSHRVRLGEWDLSTANDCEDGICSNAPIDLDIEEIVVHSNYDTKDQSNANDIALIRFTRPVQYSGTVSPICLPLSASLRNRSHVGQLGFAAGWGKTEHASSSEKKLKVELNVTSLQDCAPGYRRSGILLKAVHMCAGGVRGKDTCSGDSGGPLMRQLAGAWHLIGVVSFGPHKCGSLGIPGNYCTETPIDVEVEKIIVHQAYVPRDRNHHNDIALIRLAQKVSYSWTINPICLPLSSAVPSRTHGHTIMHAAGWGIGTTDSTIPRKVKMEFKVVDLNECTSEYRRYGVTLNSTQLCATPYRLQDTCSRDSGGPLMQLINGTWYLLGVASINPGNCGPSRPPPDERVDLPSPPECGLWEASRLSGGQLTQIEDFPWTALIEYAKPDGSYGFHCGGTLINQEHIVTAAHCVSSLPDGWKVNRVRLGEWDLATDEDCQYGYCNHPVMDLNVAKIIVHDEYDVSNRTTSNDIALIRFKEKVNFTDTVQPI